MRAIFRYRADASGASTTHDFVSQNERSDIPSANIALMSRGVTSVVALPRHLPMALPAVSAMCRGIIACTMSGCHDWRDWMDKRLQLFIVGLAFVLRTGS